MQTGLASSKFTFNFGLNFGLQIGLASLKLLLRIKFISLRDSNSLKRRNLFSLQINIIIFVFHSKHFLVKSTNNDDLIIYRFFVHNK